MQNTNSMTTMSFDFKRAKLFTPVVTSYVVIAVLFKLFSALTMKLAPSMVISTQGILDGKIWTPLTFTFINGCTFPFVFDIIIFFLMGCFIEKQWKSLRFLLFLIIVSVLSGITWALITPIFGQSATQMGGMGCLSLAIIMVFGILRRNTYAILPGGFAKTSHVAIGLIVISALFSLSYPINLIMFSSVFWGYLYVVLLRKIDVRRAGGVSVSSKNKDYGGFVDID